MDETTEQKVAVSRFCRYCRGTIPNTPDFWFKAGNELKHRNCRARVEAERSAGATSRKGVQGGIGIGSSVYRYLETLCERTGETRHEAMKRLVLDELRRHGIDPDYDRKAKEIQMSFASLTTDQQRQLLESILAGLN